MFQTMNYVILKRLRLKYEMYTPSDCKDIGPQLESIHEIYIHPYIFSKLTIQY